MSRVSNAPRRAVGSGAESLVSATGIPLGQVSPAELPVARPRLPPMAAVLPYLKRIDEARTYSNFGPLNAVFEDRLAQRLGASAPSVVTCASATAGLTLALMASVPERGLCLVPAWTFAATAHAVLAAGLTPYLVDVDPETWALTPEIAAAALRTAPDRVVAVVPVAPFGAPLDAPAWDRFGAESGVAVVIDAAAGFDAMVLGQAPAVVSLHATKVFGIGEGGFVASRDEALIADIRARSNFGFNGSRNAAAVGFNGKLSEYAAAVGLAGLDLWPLLRAEYAGVLSYYRSALGSAPGLKIADGLGDNWVCSTFCIQAPVAAVLRIEARLREAGVATRRWWGGGLQRHDAFRDLPSAPLPVSERLAAQTLGLPCWPGMDPASLQRIVEVIWSTLEVG